MIELVQRKSNFNNLEQVIARMEPVGFIIDQELIKKDLEKFKEGLQKTKNKINKENIKAIIKYLETLLKYTDETSKFEICWQVKDKLPYTYPTNLVCEEKYGLNTCHYIEVDTGCKLVDIDLKDLADMISFEMMFRDLGETHQSIEKLLERCGISAYESSARLTDYFTENKEYNDLYVLSKSYKIEDSPYRIRDTREMLDYFNFKKWKTQDYKDVVHFSCMYAVMVIINSILREATKINLDVKVIMINPTRLQFIVGNCTNEYIKEKLVGDISLRSFGRKFKLQQKIYIY